ncbi:ionotropic receptor 40a-like [Cylas formicarius]|uniref:ionotropic receptor 40a-like n=1 Tax=Cylas formicarius TaxID=197179 RepID=UPI0029586915|nr:ionotropic receptor 40a-like [Cylas formicarius]
MVQFFDTKTTENTFSGLLSRNSYLSKNPSILRKRRRYRIYYNQANSHKEHTLDMINWWTKEKGLFHHPTIPQRKSIYKDFHGKTLKVPVLHKPPWHFVRYYNGSRNMAFEVVGGRDDRILSLLSAKLNFRYKYFDPPERIQGSTSDNGAFNGVMGLISRREADLFIGDVGLTYERSSVVEFSFITLADSGAFVTHAPSRLNEALALLRPFQWEVWPAIAVTFLVFGPFLYAVIALPNAWHPKFIVQSQARLFCDCTWFTVTILLKQTGRELSSTHKARFCIALLSISATYVITDMYSANLTSLLAKPGREKSINNLYQLKSAMTSKGYRLYVEKHSPNLDLLENGTGIYETLWTLMESQQKEYVVESVEAGVKMVKYCRNVAVMAGRETLFFDVQRFGPKNFHLSEKLNTAYSAIALQIGCPFIEEINKLLMTIFEAGIITKMTENEYEKLGKQKNIVDVEAQENDLPNTKTETKRAAKATEDNEKLKPISLKMLQGTFYLLFIGNVCAGYKTMTFLKGRALHYVFKVADRKATMDFYRNILGMKVLRHEEFKEGCEAQCNGKYDGRWSKTMVGYGPEDNHFVLELTYNYGVHHYEKGNEFLGITIKSSEILKRAVERKWPILEGNTLEAPGGYKFFIIDAPQPTGEDPVQKVTLASSSLSKSINYWNGILGLTIFDRTDKSVLVGFDQNQAKLELKETDGPVERKQDYGRIAFSIPHGEQEKLAKHIEEHKQTVLTPLISLDTPGKATVRVIILADPNDHEICFVDDEPFRELSQPDYESEKILDRQIQLDKS